MNYLNSISSSATTAFHSFLQGAQRIMSNDECYDSTVHVCAGDALESLANLSRTLNQNPVLPLPT